MPTDQDKTIRKLRAILSADVKGYSLLMADDEVHTIEILKKYRRIMSDQIQQHSGRVVDSPGDNLLVEFSSVVDAVECAVGIQKRLKKENARFVEKKRLEFRIGVNIGDVIQDGDRIYGNGVNVAARIEGIADAGGVCISRSAFDQVNGKIELEFRYVGEHEVKNIEEPVRVYKVLLDSDSTKPLVEARLELPDTPSIAVLPFNNMSGDPGQEYFSDGLTEQIINGLCKVPNLFVIARNSSFAYKNKLFSIKNIAQELGVKYILEGSVQRSGNRIRITAQLIDATTDYHMWSEGYDRDLSDIFALQDEITLKLIEAMQVQLYGKGIYSWEVGTTNIHAYDKCMRGVEYLFKLNKGDNTHARRLFEDAINLDNAHALSYVMMGFSHMTDLGHGWSKSPYNSFEQAEIYAKKALALNDSLDLIHVLLCFIHLYKRQYVASKEEGERAIELNPNGAEAHVWLGVTFNYMGETDKAIRLIERAIRLNPIHPIYYDYFLGQAYAAGGMYENAIEICKKAINIYPDVIGSYLPLVSSCMQLNRIDEAHMYANDILRIAPNFSLNYYRTLIPFKNETKTEEIVEILRKAGLPE